MNSWLSRICQSPLWTGLVLDLARGPFMPFQWSYWLYHLLKVAGEPSFLPESSILKVLIYNGGAERCFTLLSNRSLPFMSSSFTVELAIKDYLVYQHTLFRNLGIILIIWGKGQACQCWPLIRLWIITRTT